jgi:hypothetical protein
VEGLGGEKGKGQGVFDQKATPFLRNRNRGVDRTVGLAGAGDCRCPGVGGGRRQGKRGEGRGLPSPTLTLVGDALWRWLRGEGRAAAAVGGGGAIGGDGDLGGKRGWLWRCGVLREAAQGPFIGAGMSVRGRGNIPPATGGGGPLHG